MSHPQNHVFILMGVLGGGKSAVARAVAHDINSAMLDGDYLHPPANINKMATGHAMDDNDRTPSLVALNNAIFTMQRTNGVSLLVCSGLKKRYRDRLRKGRQQSAFHLPERG